MGYARLVKKEFTGSKGTNMVGIEKIGSIPAGTYLLKAHTQDASYQQRILKQ